MWLRLCKAIEREDLFARQDFKSESDRASNRVALNALLNEALVKRTSSEWVAVLNAAGVPCGPIYSIDQMFADPQVQHLQAAAPVTHPKFGEIRLVNQAVSLTRTPASMATASPELGAHTDEVLAELGYSNTHIAELRARKVI